MFLPINDDTPRYRMQYVTFGIIALNAAIHIYTLTLDPLARLVFFFEYASLPGSYSPVRALTSGFLHGDILHLLGNMWFLFLFGGSVEGKLGHHWMAAIYGVCLFMSHIAAHLFAPGTHAMSFGASGAVGGMVGAYWFLFSRAKVDFAYLFAFWIYGVMTLAVHWAVMWLFGWDVVMWILSKYYHIDSGVSHSAHLGGVMCGLFCGFLLRRFTHIVLDGDDMYTRTIMWWRRRIARKAYFDRQPPPGSSAIDAHQIEAPRPTASFAPPVSEDSSVPERIPFPDADEPKISTNSQHGVKELPR